MPRNVAPMPPMQSSQDDARDRSNSRNKGITMEDLKRQTAMRLAQEHPHGQSLSLSGHSASVVGDPRTRHPVVTPQTLAARRNASAGYGGAPSANRDAASLHYQRLHHQGAPSHQIPGSGETQGMTPGYGGRNYYDHAPAAKGPRGRGRGRHVAPHMASSASGRYEYQPPRSSLAVALSKDKALPGNPLSSKASAYNSTASMQSRNTNSTSSKLPHGLTVHELKEMTKARLQAEAAEQMSNPLDQNAVNNNGVYDGTQRTYGVPVDGTQTNYGGTADKMGYDNDDFPFIPSQVTDHHHADQGNNIQQSGHTSPPSPAFRAYNSVEAFHDPNVQEQFRSNGSRNRLDSYPDSTNWDAASVTSHNSTVASDYLGSESAFSSGAGAYAQTTDDQGFALGRTQSYPVGMGSREATPTSVPSPLGQPYYDSSAAMAQNRQRSLTLSPRPGLSLLHEDRPGFSDEDLGIPTFSSSRHSRQPLAVRSRSSFSPVMEPPGFGNDAYANSTRAGSGTGFVGDASHENRARTSSVVSLPAISHTAEEFAVDYNGASSSSRRSSESGNQGSAAMNMNQLSRTDHTLGSHSLYGGTGIGVFRDSLGGRGVSADFSHVPAPPGLVPDTGLSAAPGMASLTSSTLSSMDSLVAGNNRGRAATWVAGAGAGGDVFGESSGLYGSGTAEETLAGDLASILKLSGAEENLSGSFFG